MRGAGQDAGDRGTRCRSCGAPIIWVATESGKRMPVDAVPVRDGTLVLVGLRARHAGPEDRKARGVLYKSHFASCPDAPLFRGTGAV